jgi:dienelactone hydrolase
MPTAARFWIRPGVHVACWIGAVSVVVAAYDDSKTSEKPLTAAQQAQWRFQIRSALFIPDPLPPVAAKTHGQSEPEVGIVAERVTYASQFGLRVPAIVYRPKQPRGKVPALIVVNGHGGDKYTWYAYYAGILYARAGAVVLTFDPIGEGERNRERRSGTRAHDRKLEPRELAQRLGGLLVSDVMQAVAYLQSRPEVDPHRIGAMGYSLGSFVLAITGAIEPHLRACVLVGGGNLDGPGGYWDNSKPMCQGIPYQSLRFLDDRPAALYALHACRGPTLIYNGLADTVVGIPALGEVGTFFKHLQERTARQKGSREGVFEFELVPGVSHRPYFLTRPVALWLHRQLEFPNWTETGIRSLPETHISRWAAVNDVPLDRLYATEEREGGTRALGDGVPALARAALNVFSADEWEREKGRLIYEAWVEAARRETPSEPRR